MDQNKISKLDLALLSSAKKIRVLNVLAWPIDAEEIFLKSWRNGDPQLPKVHFERPDLNDVISDLDSIVKQSDMSDPVQKFLAETAESYAEAGRMICNVGTKKFTEHSTIIYGRPDTVYKMQGLSAIDGAKFFLEVTERLVGTNQIKLAPAEIPASQFSKWLKTRVDEFFGQGQVEIVLTEKMSSKALASANRIRVRAGTLFSELDKDQLLQHEAFIHTATQLNGKMQPNLKSFGLGAPRTTRTQEGLAVFAELITNSMDIARLRRVALRVIAVKMALDGADFIELFKYLLESGQSEEESVRSAQRIFRGGAVKDGVVFTKDAVYLQGLMEVHTFFRAAIRDNRPNLVSNLFAGRLTMADALRLEPMFQCGWLNRARYLPSWAADLSRLASSMAYSAFITNIKLERFYLERAIELEDELKAVHG